MHSWYIPAYLQLQLTPLTGTVTWTSVRNATYIMAATHAPYGDCNDCAITYGIKLPLQLTPLTGTVTLEPVGFFPKFF